MTKRALTRKIKVVKTGELYAIKIGRRHAVWGDFGKTHFPKTPAVYQWRKEAQKGIPILKKSLKRRKLL